jgi:hypothetical protein
VVLLRSLIELDGQGELRVGLLFPGKLDEVRVTHDRSGQTQCRVDVVVVRLVEISRRLKDQ